MSFINIVNQSKRKFFTSIILTLCYLFLSTDIIWGMDYVVKQLTDDNYYDSHYQIHNGQVVWCGFDGHDAEIYLYNGTEVFQLTNDDYYYQFPQIHNGQVVWHGSDGHDSEIYVYNGAETIQLTHNSDYDAYPQIYNGKIAWVKYDGHDDEIYLYNGTQTIRLTNNSYEDHLYDIHNGQVVWRTEFSVKDEFYRIIRCTDIFLYNGIETIKLTDDKYKVDNCYNNRYKDDWAQIHNGQVVWHTEHGVWDYDLDEMVPGMAIFLYNGFETIMLTNYNGLNHNPQIHNGQVAWAHEPYGSPNDRQILLFNGSNIIQLTGNNGASASQIHNGQVVWDRYDGNDLEIFLYDGSKIIQLTDNDYNDWAPQIHNGRVVWQGGDGNNSEIFLAIPGSQPIADIISIVPNPASPTQIVNFQGLGTDPDGTITAYSWRSSINGFLSGQASFSTSSLSEGKHTIYFKVQDNDGIWSNEANQTLLIQGKPEANIEFITPNPALLTQTVTFQGSGTCPGGGEIAAYNWRSSINDFLSNQASFSISSLAEGDHIIYFRVQDDGGVWSDEVSRVLTIEKNPDTTSDKEHGEKPSGSYVSEPINVVTGNMYTTQYDLSIPGRELNFDFNRTYNSHKVYQGSMGYGWTHSYNITLTDLEDKVRIMIEDGRAIYFTKEGDGSLTPPSGEHSVLEKEDESFVWRLKNGITYYFDDSGKLLLIKGRNDNHISLTYTDNLLTKVTDSVYREVIFSYNTDNRLSQITGPTGRTVQYNYDSEGNLTSVVDLNGNTTSYQYDSNHNLTKVTDPEDRSLYYEYDGQDRCISTYYDDDITKIVLSYDPVNRKTTVINSRGFQTVRTYDENGLVTQVEDSRGNSIYYTWDSNYNRTQVTDENGNATKMSYDSKGNLLSTTDAQGNETTFEYEPVYSFISKTTDSQENSTLYDYDANGNLTLTTDALGNETAYSYDNFGQVILKTDPNSITVVYEYDDKGNLISTTNSFDAETKFTYDALGNFTSTTDPKSNTTTYTYDNANQLVKTTYPDSTFTQFGYDKAGNRTSITDPNGNVTKFEYTPTNKISKKEDPLGRIILYTYDTEENLIKVTDPKDNITEYAYDNLNRLIEEKNPLGLTKAYIYDKVGNKTSFTDEKSQNTQYQYNNLNQLTKITYPDDTYITYTYDKLGRKTSAEDSNLRKTQYSYDSLGRIITVDGPDDNDTISYEYDKLGSRTKMTDQDGEATTYNYDELNRLVQVIDSREQTTDYMYDENDNLVSTFYPNNMEANYVYDSMDRLRSLTNISPHAEVISSYEYTYDSGGRKTKVTLSNGEINYTYDKANQLTQETRNLSNSSYSLSYQYDLSGNRRQMIKNGETIDYAYNSFNQLINQTNSAYSGGNKALVTGEVKDNNIDKVLLNSVPAIINNEIFSAKVPLTAGLNTVTVQAIDTSGNTTISDLQVELDPSLEAAYTYDNNGNLIQKSYRGEHTVYSYNYDNQLTKILYPEASIEEYTYDTQGKRIARTKGEQTINYLYDGNTAILEKSEGETIASYTRGLSLGGGIGSIISKYDGESTYYYLYDGQGNVTCLTDEDGEVIISYECDAFGNITYQSGSLTQDYQYQTKEYNPDSGLVFFGARYYDPTIGRFTTPDPLGMVDGPNIYVYLNNDPINLLDPWGLCPKEKRVIYLEARGYVKIRDISLAFPGMFFISEWSLYGVKAYYGNVPENYELKNIEKKTFYKYPFGFWDYKYENIWYEYGPPDTK